MKCQQNLFIEKVKGSVFVGENMARFTDPKRKLINKV
jgi:hypothetical protein